MALDENIKFQGADADTDAICEKKSELLYTISGHDIQLPVKVGRASNAFATFLVNAKAAQAWIGDSGLRVIEILPNVEATGFIGAPNPSFVDLIRVPSAQPRAESCGQRDAARVTRETRDCKGEVHITPSSHGDGCDGLFEGGGRKKRDECR